MSHTIGQVEQDKQDKQESNSNSNEPSQDSLSSGAGSLAAVSGLSDVDYEFLFNQLLEGIAHGWHDRRIVKFFNQLGDRGKQSDWVAWLGRVQDKLLKLPFESKRQLGTLMIRFGELTQSATEVKQIGAASHHFGRELLFGDNVSVIWEYVGPDLSLITKPVETEQELSARLPNDFASLGEKLTENVKLDSTTAPPLPEEHDTHYESNLELKPNEEINLDTEEAIELENIGSNAREDAFSETLVSADELWAEDLSTVRSKADVPEFTKEIELDLDLDRDLPDNSDRITSHDEEFEFELDRYPRPEVEASSIDSVEAAESSQVAADLQSESHISTPNELADALEAFDLDSEIESKSIDSPNTPAVSEEANLESKELKPTIAPDYSAIEQQNDGGLPAIATGELDNSSLEVIESWFDLGLKQVSAGEYSKAISSWDKALNINANLPEAWHNRGSALGRLGDYEAAVKSFQNALSIDPNNCQAWNDRAHALYQLENWSEAVESWSKAIEIMPGNHLFWYNRGCSLEQLSKWSEAIASYEKALEIKPDFQPGRSRYINLVADNSRPN